MAATKSHKPSLIPIILTAFIDMLGIGIIIPVIAPLIVNNETGIVPGDVSEETRNIIYGVLSGLYPIMQFFGAPILGALSDRYGRKKMLFLSIFGSGLGFALFAVGILTNSLWLLFVSRAIDGFTGGNISILYSAISDISENKSKAQNFGLVGMALGFGFVVGPFIGGIMADDTMVSWFGPSVPFWFAAALCGVNLLMVLFVFKETLKKVNPRKVTILSGFNNFRKAFAFGNLRMIFSVVFLLTLGFAFFTQFFSVFMMGQFGYGERELGFFFGYIGICIAFTQGFLLRVVNKRFTAYQIIKVSALGLACVLPISLIPENVSWEFVIAPFIAIFHGLTLPNINALVSMQASEDQQGQILGINQSVTSLGNAVPPILAGLLSTQSLYYPTLAAAFFTLVGWFLFVFFFSPKKVTAREKG